MPEDFLRGCKLSRVAKYNYGLVSSCSLTQGPDCRLLLWHRHDAKRLLMRAPRLSSLFLTSTAPAWVSFEAELRLAIAIFSGLHLSICVPKDHDCISTHQAEVWRTGGMRLHISASARTRFHGGARAAFEAPKCQVHVLKVQQAGAGEPLQRFLRPTRHMGQLPARPTERAICCRTSGRAG